MSPRQTGPHRVEGRDSLRADIYNRRSASRDRVTGVMFWVMLKKCAPILS